MKKVSVLILIAILGVVGWAMPAGAQKIRLTDDQLDEIMAGAKNKGTVTNSVFGDNAGAADPVNFNICFTVPMNKCSDPVKSAGPANAVTPNADAMAGSASANSSFGGSSASASAPPVTAITIPSGPGTGGKNTIIQIQATASGKKFP